MKRVILIIILFIAIVSITSMIIFQEEQELKWSFNASLIEACSCPMFCQCYFNSKPAAHHSNHHGKGDSEHFCKFNIAAIVNVGFYGNTDLRGVKFWQAGDTGPDFSEDLMNWNTVIFDPSVSKEQKEGIIKILEHIWSLAWKEFKVAGDAEISWQANEEAAEALLDNGKLGKIKLIKFPGMDGNAIVIKNLSYWGVPRHDGFVLMPNEFQAYYDESKAFVFENSNGFMITIDINSSDIKN
jgi:hypothetical protein